jgi:hypothetical protein
MITLNEDFKEQRDLLESKMKIKLNKEQEKYRDIFERKKEGILEGYYDKYIKEFESATSYSINVVVSDYKNMAILKYFETGNPEIFREYTKKSGSSFITIFKRAMLKEPPIQSWFSRSGEEYEGFLEILAGGDLEEAKEYAKISEFVKPGDLSHIKPENRSIYKSYPALLEKYFFRMFRALLLDYPDADRLALAKEAELYFDRKYKAFVGYAQVFQAIELRDEKLYKEAMKMIMKRYGLMRQRFYLQADNFIAFWPLGMANLGRHYGFTSDINYPRLPRELVINPK